MRPPTFVGPRLTQVVKALLENEESVVRFDVELACSEARRLAFARYRAFGGMTPNSFNICCTRCRTEATVSPRSPAGKAVVGGPEAFPTATTWRGRLVLLISAALAAVAHTNVRYQSNKSRPTFIAVSFLNASWTDRTIATQQEMNQSAGMTYDADECRVAYSRVQGSRLLSSGRV